MILKNWHFVLGLSLFLVLSRPNAMAQMITETPFLCQFGSNENFDLSLTDIVISRQRDTDKQDDHYFMDKDLATVGGNDSEITFLVSATSIGAIRLVISTKPTVSEGSIFTGVRTHGPIEHMSNASTMTCLKTEHRNVVLAETITETLPSENNLAEEAIKLCNGGSVKPAGQLQTKQMPNHWAGNFDGYYVGKLAFDCIR